MYWTKLDSVYGANISAKATENAALIVYSRPFLSLHFIHFYGSRWADSRAHSAAYASIIIEFEHSTVVCSQFLAYLGVHNGRSGLEEIANPSPNSVDVPQNVYTKDFPWELRLCQFRVPPNRLMQEIIRLRQWQGQRVYANQAVEPDPNGICHKQFS